MQRTSLTDDFESMKITGKSRAGGRLRRESGSALLIVLAFIVILAVVLVTFLSSSRRALQQSESSSTLLKTQMLGEVATAAIIEDLTDEMKAGADKVPAVGDIMEVSQPWAMVPFRVVKDEIPAKADYATLVKQSVSGKKFFETKGPIVFTSSGKSRASAVNTLAPSRNQRIISPERWDAPRLLGGPGGLVNFSGSGQIPDWILITRAGVSEDGATVGDVSDKSTANTGYVLGRFAYNIYEVDGLLDINVAGFDPKDTKSVTAAASKGSSALADLRALPGLGDEGDVQAIVDWRNKETKAYYPSMIAGLTATSGTNATPGNWGEPGGFQEPYTDGTVTDNRFFGRQDLLKYFDHEFSGTGVQRNALPFLTTFSADTDQPSFRPDPKRPPIERSASAGGNDQFGNEAKGESEQINRSFLSVLDNDKNPIVKRRFPLDRLKYVYPDPADADKVKISEYFGLAWNGDETNPGWNYADGDYINTLQEVKVLGRAPNMIELLKAAITVGSLGGQFVGNEPNGSPRAINMRDGSTDYQLLRIAACIIDQYDADSFPTRIRFRGGWAYGDEDIPYMYGVRTAAYRQQVLVKADVIDPTKLPPAAAAGPLNRSVIMIQPVLWNPHALPETAVAATLRPTNFRITAKSGNDVVPVARTTWWLANASSYGSNWPTNPNKPVDDKDKAKQISFSPDVDFMSFSISMDDSKMAAFREPYALKSPNYPPDSGSKSHNSGGDFSEITVSGAEQNDSSPLRSEGNEIDNHTIGFRAGWSWSGPWQSTGNATYLQEGRISTNGVDFELQYQSPSGKWITYDSYEKFYNPNETYRLDRWATGVLNPLHMRYFLRADPRVDRYGARAPLLLPAGTGMKQGISIRPTDAVGFGAAGGWHPTTVDPTIYNFTVPSDTGSRYWGLVSENKAAGVVRYEDPDGVLRFAMGGYSSGLNGLPMATGNDASRPVVLNRPFRSVAELGNVLRDQPWKQLDFFSPQSADAALLDVFCIYEPEDATADPVVSGRVNLNTQRSEVIEALLRGVELQKGTALSDSTAQAAAKALVKWTADSDSDNKKGPLRNRSELVGKYVSGSDYLAYSGFSTDMADTLSSVDKAIPIHRQNVLRALADAGTTRTWTFLIDLIVQDGQFVKAGGAPGDFTVRGEKRFWIHVSLDRFTGKVISKYVEEVHE